MTPSISLTHYLTTSQAAEILKLSARTLERMRIDGSGPPLTRSHSEAAQPKWRRERRRSAPASGYVFPSYASGDGPG